MEIGGVEPSHHHQVKRIGTFAAGTLRIMIPAHLVKGHQVRYRVTVTQQECEIVRPRCSSQQVTTGWHDVPVLHNTHPLPYTSVDVTHPPADAGHLSTPRVATPSSSAL